MILDSTTGTVSGQVKANSPLEEIMGAYQRFRCRPSVTPITTLTPLDLEPSGWERNTAAADFELVTTSSVPPE